MILSSADILRILGGSEIIRLSAKISIVDSKPALSGAEGLFVYINRFPFVDEFQATWTIWIESDGSEPDDLVVAEIKTLLPSTKVSVGLMTVVTTTDFLSTSTQRAPEASRQTQVKADLAELEERFQSLAEDVQDQMLLVNSGRPGKDGKDGRDGADGRDGKDLVATDAELFDLQDVEQGIQMERGQVLTWDGSKWTNLYVRQTMSAGGPAGGGGGSGGDGVTRIVAGSNVTIDPESGTGVVTINSSGTGGGAVDSVNGQTGVVVLTADDVGALESGDNVSELVNDAGYITLAEVPESGIPEAPQDGNYYVRQDGAWVSLVDALTALNDRTIDGGDFNTGSSAGDTEVVDGGSFS